MARSPFNVTLICMEPSRPAAVAEIVARINAEADLPLRVILRARESAEVAVAERHRKIADDLAASDLVIISHVLMDEESVPLERLIRDHVPPHATILGISSAAPLMRLTRVGRFSIKRRPDADDNTSPDAPPSGAMKLKALLGRIAGGRDITPYLKELMIAAPRLLRLIPGRMRDLRSYIESYLYFVECSERNIRSMLLMLADRYHAPLSGTLAGRYDPPIVYPSEGIHHPDAPAPFPSRKEYLAWYATRGHSAERSLVGLILLRGDVLMGEHAAIDATIHAFEAGGIGVIAAFGSSFDYRTAVEKLLLDGDGGGIGALVSLTAFPLVGGHVGSDIAGATGALERYNLPYFSPIPLIFQTVEEWRVSEYGIGPMQTALHVALPELEGAIEPMVTSGVTISERGKTKTGIDERTAKLVRRVERWLALRRKQNAEKRIAITIFSFPPGKGAVGTAAYLDVFRSLHNTLARMKADGYTIDLPASPEEIIERIVTGDDKLAPMSLSELNVAARLTVAEYTALAPESKRVAAMWGPPPGSLNSDGRDLLIYGFRCGNIFIGVQPSFGYEGDPMRLLFAKGATPHHGFLAYYTWIEHLFRADAHLHFGTHGALEFMPGKQVGLDSASWPDILIGDLPNLYFYAINNPSEGTIAKRRSLAALVGYQTPPLENAGLYRELGDMKEMVHAYQSAEPGDPRRALTLESLAEKVGQLDLDKDVPPPATESENDRFVARLHAHLIELESRLIPTGLHIAGEQPSPAGLADLLLAISEYDRPEAGIRALTDIIAGRAGENYGELYRRADTGDHEAMERYLATRATALEGITALLIDRGEGDRERIVRSAKVVASRSGLPARSAPLRATMEYLLAIAGRASEHREFDALLRGMSGGYITAAIGGDPVRNPEVLPSGRNIHSLDPAAIPSPMALRNGKRVVEMMLRKNLEETGQLPRSIGMVLWGLDTIKTQGEAIAQVFALIGIEPEPNSIGRVSRLRVIPLEKLGRPRIDVTIQASGIFRDIFGLQIEILDDAIRLAASLDEPEEMNFIRSRCREMTERLGLTGDEATTRIFSNAAGAYGTNVDHTVAMSAWRTADDLAEVFTRRKSFAYGRSFGSRESRRIFEELASGIDTTFQNLDSSEVGITDVDHYFEYLGGFTNVVERRSGRRPTPLVADTTTARGKVRTLEATIRLEVRTKLLNPKWFEGMLSHGYQGVEEIRKRLDYTFGFSATAGAVDPWVYEAIHGTYVADETVRHRMEGLNIHAYSGMVRRLLEANERGFWTPGENTLEDLRSICDELEDRLEGVG
ncbi:MAG: magnesium chelatase subunit H [Candidatus Kapaibacterium sp.]